MKRLGLKIITYIPMAIGFFLVYLSLDVNMAWIWRIPQRADGIFYLATLSFWYIGSWLYVKLKSKSLGGTLRQWLPRGSDNIPAEFDILPTQPKDLDIEVVKKSAALFNKRMLLVQLGFLPAFVGMHIGLWILRHTVYPAFNIGSGFNWAATRHPSFANALDIAFTGIALGILAIWFVCSINFVKKGLSKLETVLLLNAAAILALVQFLHRYLIVHNLAGLEAAISVFGGLVIDPYYEVGWGWSWGLRWATIDPMHFYEYLSRLFIRFAPWIPTDNLLPHVFISFGLLLAISIAGAKIGESKRYNN